jgi:hypothetical protein
VRLAPTRPLLFFVLPAGGFFSIALLMAGFNWIEAHVQRRARRAGASAGTAVAGGPHA